MKNFPFFIINFLLSFSLFFLVIFPKAQTFFDWNNEILEKDSELRYQEENFQELREISEKLKTYENSLSKIDSALPRAASVPLFLDFIQKASAQSGLSLKTISPSLNASAEKEGGGGVIKEMRVNLTVSGSYSDFMGFLSFLENSARLIEVENISFASSEKSPLSFNLTIKTHSY